MPIKKYRVDTDQGSYEVEVEEPGQAPAVMVNGQPMSFENYNATQQTPERSLLGTATEVGKGVLKAAGRTAVDVGEVARRVPIIGGYDASSVADTLAGKPGMTDAAFAQAHKTLASTNTPQMVGGALETAAELAVPITKAAQAIPSAARAGRAFQEVMGAAKTVPVNIQAPGQVALRIQELAERGGSMPMAVRKLLGRITDPDKGPLVYEEARDFASNISRLSANEYQRLTPAIAREVAELRVTLNKAVGEAASKAGKGMEYAQAMNEYAKAMRVRSAIESAIEGAKRSLPYATAAGAGYWLSSKVRELLSGD